MADENQEDKSLSDESNSGNSINLAVLVKQLESLKTIPENLILSLQPIINMQSEFAKITEKMVEPLIGFRLDLENMVVPVFKEFQNILAALPEQTRRTLMILAKHGWYFDTELPFGVPRIERVLESGDLELANNLLMEHFSERLSDIEKELKEKHPARALILASAFNAHSRKEYALSIPIFLIQADGICYDLINKQLYSKNRRDGAPVVAEYAKTITANTFQSILLHPLTQPLPISASAKERKEDFNDLNRHQVLHGESTDYGTEVNSFKAISFLNYVSFVLTQDKSKEHESLKKLTDMKDYS